MKASSDVMERLGQLADKADNFCHAAQIPLSPRIHITALRGGMEDIRDELRAIFREVTGDDPWADEPMSGA